jgi:hypothetical protein
MEQINEHRERDRHELMRNIRRDAVPLKSTPELRQILRNMGVDFPTANLFTDAEYYRQELVKIVLKHI